MQNSQSSLHPTIALLRETNEQPEMYIRPYETHGGGFAMAGILDATQNGELINSITLSPVAGNFLNLSPDASFGAKIANGWRTKRFRFVLNFRSHKTINGDYFSFYATGYTDVFDISMNNHISPQTKFYFNNIVMHKHQIQLDQISGVPYERETRISEIQVISKNNIGGVNFVEQQNSFNTANCYLRPADVLCSAVAAIETIEQMGGVSYPIINGNASNPVAVTHRDNNNPINYLGKTLKALRTAAVESVGNVNEIGGLGIRSSDLEKDVAASTMHTAYKMLTEPNRETNELTSILFGFPSFTTHAFVTWRDLAMLWPDLDRMLDIKLIPKVKEIGMNPLDSDNWHGAGYEHILATSLVTHLPTMMIERSIGRISFNATNKFRTQGLVDFDPVIFQYTNSAMTSNVAVPPLTLESLRNKIIHEIIFPLTAMGQMDFEIECDINLIGNSTVCISLNGGYKRIFSAPQFADNLFTPLLTGNSNKLSELSTDFMSLTSNMNSGLGVTRNNGVVNQQYTQQAIYHHLNPSQMGSIPQPQFAQAVNQQPVQHSVPVPTVDQSRFY